MRLCSAFPKNTLCNSKPSILSSLPGHSDGRLLSYLDEYIIYQANNQRSLTHHSNSTREFLRRKKFAYKAMEVRTFKRSVPASVLSTVIPFVKTDKYHFSLTLSKHNFSKTKRNFEPNLYILHCNM